MCSLAAHDKPRLTRLAQGFQDNLTGLNNYKKLSHNIPNFSCSEHLPLTVFSPLRNATCIRQYSFQEEQQYCGAVAMGCLSTLLTKTYQLISKMQ